MSKKNKDEPTVIKKYANRRLYDTGRSSYVTLDDLYEMVKEGHEFVVRDAKSNEDLTRQVLTQIIVEQESKQDQQMLPISFLRQLIGFYGDNMQPFVPNYLEQSLQAFSQNQEQIQEMFPVKAFEEMGRQNMAMFEQAMKAWTWKDGATFGGHPCGMKRRSTRRWTQGLQTHLGGTASGAPQERLTQLKEGMRA